MFIGGVKIHNDLRERIEMVGVAYEGMGEIDPINIQTHITEVFSQVTPEQMAEYQRVDNQIRPIIPWVQEGKVPPKSVLYKVKSKTCRKLYFQFDRCTNYENGHLENTQGYCSHQKNTILNTPGYFPSQFFACYVEWSPRLE